MNDTRSSQQRLSDTTSLPPPDEAKEGALAMSFSGEVQLFAALRQGDESAFLWMVNTYYPAMLRLALFSLDEHSLAEEVVQETWMLALQWLLTNESHLPLKLWLFRLLLDSLNTRARQLYVGMWASLDELLQGEPDQPAVDPERFCSAQEPWPGGWRHFPRPWDKLSAEQVSSPKGRTRLQQAIVALPRAQRLVLLLRDLEGWSAGEVSQLFALSQSQYQLLLHGARSKVRCALEQYLEGGEEEGQDAHR